ncbi:acyltransferase family protein [Mucilaginibacter pineti]|uniref:acyltransferase family protein n=1 Tax=Mucilaginibacter pineti TaxID=1391627 RepID=UPI0013BEA8A7
MFYAFKISKVNLSHVLKRENNNFDLIRLICSLSVIVFHAYYLFKSDQRDTNPLQQVRQASGSLAVYVFFYLSGVFITASFINSNAFKFIVMRLLRIWPALIVCLLFTIFFVGPIVSSYTLRQYFLEKSTWDYLLHGILLYHLRFELPGPLRQAITLHYALRTGFHFAASHAAAHRQIFVSPRAYILAAHKIATTPHLQVSDTGKQSRV